MAAPSKERPYLKGVTLSMNFVSTTGDLFTTKSDNEVKTNVVCPDCDVPVKMNQRYVCPNDTAHGPYALSDVKRAADDENGSFKFVDADALAAAKKSVLTAGSLAIGVYDRAEVEAATITQGAAYVFRPTNNESFYTALLDTLNEHDDLALIGMMNMRGNDKLVMLTLGLNGNLVLRELLWPEDVKEQGTPATQTLSPAESEMLAKLIEMKRTEAGVFDPAGFKKEARARMVEVIGSSDGATAPAAKSAPAQTGSLMDALAASVAAVSSKPKSGARKASRATKRAMAR